ncbi:MAG: histone deacetylase [Planctomycetota bacterium]|nr:MAG: histone deacetylase [Planctomycetota bacterium]
MTALPVLLLQDALCLEHHAGVQHPESPERLRLALQQLLTDLPDGVQLAAPRDATDTELARAHGADYLAQLAATAGKPRTVLDADTATSAHSWAAARRACGALLTGLDACLDGEARGAFALVRPPGHHAERDAAMGFCLVNHVAVAAEHARARGCQRVLIVDPDVHHGNGTQHSFEARDDVLFISSHRWPFYPGTGAPGEVGVGRGAGSTLNLPLQAGMGDAELLALWQQLAAPVVAEFAPDCVLVSAGFDAWQHDPLGGLRVTERAVSRRSSRSSVPGPTRTAPASSLPCSKAVTTQRV